MQTQFSLLELVLKCFCCQQQNINRICLNEQAIKNNIFLLCNSCCKKNDKTKKYRTSFSSIQSDVFPLSLFSMNAFQKQSFIKIPEIIEKCRQTLQKKYESLIQLFKTSTENIFLYLKTIQNTLNYEASQNLQFSLKNPTNINQAKNNVKSLKWLIKNKEKISDADKLNKNMSILLQKFENEFITGMTKIQKLIQKLFESINSQSKFLNPKQLNEKIEANSNMQVEQQQKENVSLSNNNNNKLNFLIQKQQHHQQEKQIQNNKQNPLNVQLKRVKQQQQSQLYKIKLTNNISKQNNYINLVSSEQQQSQVKQKQIQSIQSYQLIRNSSIIKTQKDLLKLMNFFDQKIKKFDLVFKANQNKYSTINFYEQCSHMTDTIIICQLWKGKVIGGYTPLSFNFSQQFKQNDQVERVRDESGSSFLFSLSQNQKFNLNKQKYTIQRHKDKQIIQFGDSLFYIGRNTNKFGKFNILDQVYFGNSDQQNKNCYREEKNLIREKFTGTKCKGLFLKEWQVIKVQFQ